MTRQRRDLLHQLKTLHDYVDEHFEAITDHKAGLVADLIQGAWHILERRKESHRNLEHST